MEVFEAIKGLEEAIRRYADGAYKRGYQDGQMDLRKEQEATQRYWGKQEDKTK